jgi:GTP cyclohydrolase I
MSKNISDVQNWPDHRKIAIQKTGVKGVKHPAVFQDANTTHTQAIQAVFSLFVGLDPAIKGTHMSRFLDILHEQDPFVLSYSSLSGVLDTMLTRLNSLDAFIQSEFKWFISKTAPQSGRASFLDYDIAIDAQLCNDQVDFNTTLNVPVTTLCPCSKEISNYGAHNQRSIIQVQIQHHAPIALEPLIKHIEQQGSCELYGIIKRNDEKVVTEKAFENPKFVEDVVRDTAIMLEQQGFQRYRVTSENLESIHNHSAYAEVNKLKTF